MTVERVRIDTIGHRGDGSGVIMDDEGKTLGDCFVPFTLPGEIVTVSGKGARRHLETIVEASGVRVEPPCPHFGSCGGCQLQHLEPQTYRSWKRDLLTSALRHAGIEAEPEPMRHYPLASRRRAVLTALPIRNGWQLGYSQKASHDLVDIGTCPILTDELQRALPGLRETLNLLGGHGIGARHGVRITLLGAENGLDFSFSFRAKPSDRLVRDTARHGTASQFLRITYNGETVFERERPLLSAGIASVTPPPDAFVQAVAAAEADMAELVTGHLGGCKRVADLFCGFGTFALRLAQNSMVHGSDSETAALSAMDRAWRETGGKLRQLTFERRDLFVRPFMAAELKPFDGVVFDPPRAGAEAQSREIARSGVRRVAAVSCNPQTLARDLAILCEVGFRIERITPIDQFAFSPHLETVALLSR